MIGRAGSLLRQLRIALNRSEWFTRLLHLPVAAERGYQRGLIMIQIDGLSHTQLERALAAGEMRFLRRLMRREHYQLQRMYAGVPASTAAVQANLFYGIEQAVPGFCYMDRHTRALVRMIEPSAAAKVERELDQRSPQPLLAGGSAYVDNFTGGADEAHFCPTARGWGQALRDASPLVVALLIVGNAYSFVRLFALVLLEAAIGCGDFLRGIVRGQAFIKELKFIPTRVAISVLLRELVVIGARIDIVRGLPIIHMNMLGYDEQAHRRGPASRFAHWTLKGIDDAIARLWRAAQLARLRHYDLWVYSDHGQESATPYAALHDRTLAEAVAAIFSEHCGEPVAYRTGGPWGAQLKRAEQLGGSWLQRLFPLGNGEEATGPEPGLTIAALGPVGMIYWAGPLGDEERVALARRLGHAAGVPLVLFRDAAGAVHGWAHGAAVRLPADAARVLGARHPFTAAAAADLARLCEHEHAGDFVLCGSVGDERPLTFALENGAHGGAGAEETTAFVLLPADVRLAPADGHTLRIGDLREAALAARGHGTKRIVNYAEPRRTLAQSLRILTYNVHACRGMDGRLAPERIARVISRCEADVVCLQELDVHRARTGGVDQAQCIARILGMDHHFHPAVHVAGERYGDAILTRLPMQLVKAAALPGSPPAGAAEPRGALWVQIMLDNVALQVINTHLGLRARERRLQTAALLSDQWLGHPDCRQPVVLCGDLNAMPRSPEYGCLQRRLRDAQTALPGHRPQATFAGSFPIIRVDHVFVDDSLEVRAIEVPGNELCRVASDHLPLLVEVRIAAAADA